MRTNGGSGSHRKLTADLHFLDDADRTALQASFYNVGKGADFYMSCYPGDGGMKEIEYSFIGKRESDLKFTHNFTNNWWTRLVVVEA